MIQELDPTKNIHVTTREFGHYPFEQAKQVIEKALPKGEKKVDAYPNVTYELTGVTLVADGTYAIGMNVKGAIGGQNAKMKAAQRCARGEVADVLARLAETEHPAFGKFCVSLQATVVVPMNSPKT